MGLLVLSGERQQTDIWSEGSAQSLAPLFVTVTPVRYLHWATKHQKESKASIDVNAEAEHLAELAASHTDGVSILAQKVGTWVALKAVHDGLIKPESCVLVGTLVRQARKRKLPVDSWLENYSVPTMFVQQTYDRDIGAVALNELLVASHATDYVLHEIPGKDGVYPRSEQLQTAYVAHYTF